MADGFAEDAYSSGPEESAHQRTFSYSVATRDRWDSFIPFSCHVFCHSILAFVVDRGVRKCEKNLLQKCLCQDNRN